MVTLLKYVGGVILAVGIFLLVIGYFFRAPSNDRDWSLDQTRLPSATFKGDMVTITDVRNFSYSDKDTFIPAYYDKTYDLTQLVRVDYIVEKFSGIGAAHTFLSFGFTDGSFVAISAEIRKEKGETFSPFWGALRQYELTYVIADEHDVIGLRANYRHDPVYVYPTRANKAQVRSLFISMLERANVLRQKPEFYNTFTNTCTTNIAWHIDQIASQRIPFDLRLLLPSNSDVMAYDLGLLDTSVPLDALRATYQVNKLAEKYADDSNFSLKIRGI